MTSPDLSTSMSKSIYSRRHDRLCAILVEKRKKVDLTQQQLADQLGKPQSYIAKVEGGERRLDVIEFVELCEEMGADPAKIVRTIASK